MSYILDALRRSESERYQEKLPELGGQTPLWLRGKERRSVWPALVVVALALNAVIVGVLLWPRDDPSVPAAVVAPRLDAASGSASTPVAGPVTGFAPGVRMDSVTGPALRSSSQESSSAHEEAPEPLSQGRHFPPEVSATGEPMPGGGVGNAQDSVFEAQPAFIRKPLDDVPPPVVADFSGDAMAVGEGPASGDTWEHDERPSMDSESEPFEEQATMDSGMSPLATVVRPASQGSMRDRGTDTGELDADGSMATDLQDIPHIDELSAAEKARIPALRFSSHIYSSSPEARRIMINQRTLREGQTFQGLRVVEITTEGVVLSLAGRVFQIPVLRDWNPDGR